MPEKRPHEDEDAMPPPSSTALVVQNPNKRAKNELVAVEKNQVVQSVSHLSPIGHH